MIYLEILTWKVTKLVLRFSFSPSSYLNYVSWRFFRCDCKLMHSIVKVITFSVIIEYSLNIYDANLLKNLPPFFRNRRLWRFISYLNHYFNLHLCVSPFPSIESLTFAYIWLLNMPIQKTLAINLLKSMAKRTPLGLIGLKC